MKSASDSPVTCLGHVEKTACLRPLPRRRARAPGRRRRLACRPRAAFSCRGGSCRPARQLGTTLVSCCGSAGEPSSVSSLKRNPAILPLRFGWGRTARRAYPRPRAGPRAPARGGRARARSALRSGVLDLARDALAERVRLARFLPYLALKASGSALRSVQPDFDALMSA